MRVAQALLALSVAAAVVWLLEPPPTDEETAERADLSPDDRLEEPPIRVALAAPPEPERIPEATPDPPRASPPPRSSPAEPPAVVPDSAALERGAELMESGTFPRLRATYHRIGFADYRDAMLALGGRFFLFDSSERRPVAEIEPRSGAIRGETVRPGLSRWPRDVTRHLASALEEGRRRYGARVTRVVLLPPRGLDAALLGALDARLREVGLRPSDALQVSVAYEMRGVRLHCAVVGVTLRDGTERPLPLLVDLSRTGMRS
jgi:hypothetical protein